jgi:hypothetical protein
MGRRALVVSELPDDSEDMYASMPTADIEMCQSPDASVRGEQGPCDAPDEDDDLQCEVDSPDVQRAIEVVSASPEQPSTTQLPTAVPQRTAELSSPNGTANASTSAENLQPDVGAAAPSQPSTRYGLGRDVRARVHFADAGSRPVSRVVRRKRRIIFNTVEIDSTK